MRTITLSDDSYNALRVLIISERSITADDLRDEPGDEANATCLVALDKLDAELDASSDSIVKEAFVAGFEESCEGRNGEIRPYRLFAGAYVEEDLSTVLSEQFVEWARGRGWLP